MDKVNFINNEGVTVECDVLNLYESKITNKKYVIYTDNTFENNFKNIYASEMIEKGSEIFLKDINNKADEIIIEKIIENMEEK